MERGKHHNSIPYQQETQAVYFYFKLGMDQPGQSFQSFMATMFGTAYGGRRRQSVYIYLSHPTIASWNFCWLLSWCSKEFLMCVFLRRKGNKYEHIIACMIILLIWVPLWVSSNVEHVTDWSISCRFSWLSYFHLLHVRFHEVLPLVLQQCYLQLFLVVFYIENYIRQMFNILVSGQHTACSSTCLVRLDR
jgi:hypothetical protein